MTKDQAKREFKKHYRRAMKLKEGGKAWEREMQACDRYQAIAMAKYQEEQRLKYNG